MLQAVNPSMLRVALAAAFAAAMFTADGQAHDPLPQTRASVEIVDRSEGRVLPVYWHQGRRYVVGKPGNEYAIGVRNGSSGRVLAVMSVDGVNVISGDTASPQQSGYVLAPYESADIAGWRKSLARTAAFYFTALPDSYAARTGRPNDVGVIGVALFRRKPPAPISNAEPLRRERGAAADSATPAEPQLGTGHGRHETSPAHYVNFERATSTPAEVVALYYDSRANLVARGIIRDPIPVAPYPRPFPGFVPDPAG